MFTKGDTNNLFLCVLNIVTRVTYLDESCILIAKTKSLHSLGLSRYRLVELSFHLIFSYHVIVVESKPSCQNNTTALTGDMHTM